MANITNSDPVVIAYKNALDSYNDLNPSTTIDVAADISELLTLVNDSTLFISEIQDFDGSGGDLSVVQPDTVIQGSTYASGSGSTNRTNITIGLPLSGSVDPLSNSYINYVDKVGNFAGILAHELGHFEDRNFYGMYGDEPTWIASMFISEGKATYNNILIDEQIEFATGTMAGIAVPLPDARTVVNTINSMGLSQDAAILYLASLYSNLPTSINNKTYLQYYLSGYKGSTSLLSNIFSKSNLLSPNNVSGITFNLSPSANSASNQNFISMTISYNNGAPPATLMIGGYQGLTQLNSGGGPPAFTSPFSTPSPSTYPTTIVGDSAPLEEIVGGPGNNTLVAGSGNDTLIGNSQGDNTFIGNPSPGATTTDIMVGDNGGNYTVDPSSIIVRTDLGGSSNTPEATTEPETDGEDTFDPGYGNNIMIGGNGNNDFNMTENNFGFNVIYGNKGTDFFEFNRPEGNYSPAYEVPTFYENNATSSDVEAINFNYIETFVSPYVFSPDFFNVTAIINPTSADRIIIDGNFATGASLQDVYSAYYGSYVNGALNYFPGSDGQLVVSDGSIYIDLLNFVNGDYGITLEGQPSGAGLDGQPTFFFYDEPEIFSSNIFSNDEKYYLSPNGNADFATAMGVGPNDLFDFSPGDGQLDLTETDTNSSDTNTLAFATGISKNQITVSQDGSGNLYVTDETTGDVVKLVGMANGTGGVQLITFDDGTTLTATQLIDLEASNTTGNAIFGNSGSDTLYGTVGEDIFDGGGGNDVEQGNGGADEFIYNAGYGSLEINEVQPDPNVASTATLVLGAGISEANTTFTVDGAGDILVSDETEGDQIKIDQMLEQSSSGADPFGVAVVRFADGMTLSRAQVVVLASPAAADYIAATPGQSSLYAAAGTPTVFDSEGYATYEHGSGAADEFIYNEGYQSLEISETGAADSALSLGAGITESSIALSADSAGNLYITDGFAGDQIKLDGMLSGTAYGVQEIDFGDGTVWNRFSSSDALLPLTLSANSGTYAIQYGYQFALLGDDDTLSILPGATIAVQGSADTIVGEGAEGLTLTGTENVTETIDYAGNGTFDVSGANVDIDDTSGVALYLNGNGDSVAGQNYITISAGDNGLFTDFAAYSTIDIGNYTFVSLLGVGDTISGGTGDVIAATPTLFFSNCSPPPLENFA